jgi:hypothetical protein
MEPAPCRQLRNEPSGDRPGGLFYAVRADANLFGRFRVGRFILNDNFNARAFAETAPMLRPSCLAIVVAGYF